MKRIYAILLAFIAVIASAGVSRADGMIVPFDPNPNLLGDLYSVKYHRVTIDIQDQLATTTVEQAFINETDRSIEVEYVFPVPRNAQLNKFSLFVGDKEMPAKIMTAEEARRIYEDIVRRQKDPALLEYVGQGMVKTSVFPIPPKGERKVKLVYTELLKKDGNRVEYLYPLNTEKFSKEVLQEVRIEFRLTSSGALKNVYSPSHDMNLDWTGNSKVTGRYAKEGIRPDADFRLFWTTSDDEVGATLFTYRPDSSEDGYFLFLASPKVDVGNRKAIPKNVVVVLDVSGSMQGEKIIQARNASKFIAENLNPQDRFNVIFYDDDIDPIWTTLKDYTAENRREAVQRIAKAEADGSTDIHGALLKALSMMKDTSRPNYIIFLTDGLPTAGVTDPAKISEAVKTANKFNSRVFVFGVGYDVNAVLLDRLGTENHGLAEYVPPGTDVEGAVSSFYSKIQNPALTDVALSFGGLRTIDILPKAMPDLFRGGQLVVVGRYRGSGKQKVTLTGKVGDQTKTFSYDLTFADRTDREQFSFVSRLWAQKKIGWLLEQIRLKGENKEYIEEIVKLSTRYGIITEYTSFLADEGSRLDDVAANTAEAQANLKRRAEVQTGVGGVNQSMNSGTMQKAAQAPNKAGFINDQGEEVQIANVRIIGSKTFYFKKGVWIDSEYRESMKTVEVKQLDAKYFDIANKAPTQAQYITFAPKESIIVVIDGVAYKIVK